MISETGLATAGVIYSELILSLYPILIQGIDTSLFTQYVSRFLIYPLCAILIGGFGDFWKAWGNTSAAYQSIGLGLLNLIHVVTSYIAFANLLPGLAISLFYLYPIFNIIAGNLFFNEKLSPYIGAILVLAFIGTILIATSANENTNAKDGKINTPVAGILAALVAALTETMIFIFVKYHPQNSPFYAIHNLYPAGLLFLLGSGFIGQWKPPVNIDTSIKNWGALIGFNAILGFTGYSSRFFSMPRLSSAIFSILSFIGVLASFLWGLLFLGKKPTMGGFIGGLLIASSIFLLRVTAT
jgi:drug/metabolite transporter (DMT)-like permease